VEVRYLNSPAHASCFAHVEYQRSSSIAAA
jgi:hypothetical protein